MQASEKQIMRWKINDDVWGYKKIAAKNIKILLKATHTREKEKYIIGKLFPPKVSESELYLKVKQFYALLRL